MEAVFSRDLFLAYVLYQDWRENTQCNHPFSEEAASISSV